MTLSSTTSKASYAGDGATASFAIPFMFLENGHVEAVLRDGGDAETTWTLNTEYALSGAGDPAGGTLTVSTDPTDFRPAAGETLVIRRVVPATQETDYPEGGAFPAAAHEQALDKLTMLVQQQAEEIARALRLPVSSQVADVRMAEPGAGELLRWNGSGNALETAALGDLGLNVPAEMVDPGAGDVLVHDGALWRNRAPRVIDVRDYGAVGDGTTDDTAAIQAAIDAGSGVAPVFVPTGTWRLTAALDARTGGLSLAGAGINRTILRQDANDVPILKIGHAHNHVRDFSLNYAVPQPYTATGANAIEFHADHHSVYERLSIYRAARGMYLAQVAADPLSGANWVFSTSFRNILVTRYSLNGIHISGYNGGISGNVMENIYLIGRDDDGTKLETGEALHLGAWGNGVINQINIENSKPTEAMFFNTCHGLVFNGVHFEQVECRTDFGGLMDFAGGSHVVNNVQVEINQITTTTSLSIIRAGFPGTKVKINGLSESQNLVLTPYWRLFSLPNDETGCMLRAEMVNRSANLQDGYSATAAIEILD
jgi:hypothetical protein